MSYKQVLKAGIVARQGVDGVSPVVKTTPKADGIEIEITDAYGIKKTEIKHGTTAYEYAKQGGYAGTEEEFKQLMYSCTTDFYVDETLTQQGKGADSKIVGDNFKRVDGNVSELSKQINDMKASDVTGISAELTGVLRTYFTNVQALISQLVFNTENHNAQTVIQNAKDVVSILESTSSGSDDSTEPLPESGISQNGSVLSIVSGVTATQTGTVLAIA